MIQNERQYKITQTKLRDLFLDRSALDVGVICINPPKGGISIFIAEGYQLVEVDTLELNKLITDKSHRFERVSLLFRRSENGILRHEKRHNINSPDTF